MNKISIIIPVYNVEKYLKRCLDSIINQSLKDLEIICINDGSTDNSLKIIEEYSKKDTRIKIITQKNSGISATRNRGIALANGEYISFIDSDDWVDLNFYEKLYSSAKKYNADIAAAGIIRLNKHRQKFYLNFSEEKTYTTPKEKFRICDIPDINYVWNKIYKLEKIKNLKLKFQEGIVYEDLIYTPQAIYYLDKLVTVPNTYYYYWRTPNSIVTNKSKTYKDNLKYAKNLASEFIKTHNINVENHTTKIKRFKLFGTTLFKIRTKGKKKQYILFNIFKIEKSNKKGRK